MSNNSLISLAYLQTNKNPMYVFCIYILYCLRISDDEYINLDDMHKILQEEFKIRIPINLIKMSINILQREKQILYDRSQNKIKLSNNDFNLEEFKKNRELYENQEKQLIEDMIIFLKNEYEINWGYNYAENLFLDFILEAEYSIKLLINENLDDINCDDNEKNIPNSWYIRKYLNKLIEKKSDTYTYLLNIIKGAIAFLALYHKDNINSNIYIKNTKFFIDTKLILRYMGYSYINEVQAAKELIETIEYNGGKAYVFEHTICEVEKAIDKAYKLVNEGTDIEGMDNELYAYYMNNRDIDFGVLRKEIRNKIIYKFSVIEENILENPINHIYNLDINNMENYIINCHKNWNKKSIKNDVQSVNYINILRKSRYNEQFGGKNKLPIFITSNSALTFNILEYAKNDNDIKWGNNRSPIISDIMIMSILSKNINYDNLIRVILLRDVYSSHNIDANFFKKLKKEILKIKKYHNVDMVNISELTYEKIENLIVKKSNGNEGDIDEDIIIKTFDEIIYDDNKNLSEENTDLREFVLDSSSNKIMKKLRFYRLLKFVIDKNILFLLIIIILLFIKNYLGKFFAFIFDIIVYFINKSIFHKYINNKMDYKIKEYCKKCKYKHNKAKFFTEDFENKLIENIKSKCKI